MYITCCVDSRGGHLTAPLFSLSLVGLAILIGINRVAEYRNHWSDIIAGQIIGGAIAIFLVSSFSFNAIHIIHVKLSNS